MAPRILALLEHDQQVSDVSCCFEQAGLECKICPSYSKAIAALGKDHFDLIVSEVHLENGGNVFDFLKWVRSRTQYDEIPFVLLSLKPTNTAKYLEDSIRTSARLLGAAMYISMEELDCLRLTNNLSELLSDASLKIPDSKTGE